MHLRLSFPILWIVASIAGTAAEVKGIVVADQTGLPVAAATISLRPFQVETRPKGGRATSDADGRFSAPNIAPGTYWMECTKAGFVKAEGSLNTGLTVEVKEDGSTLPAMVTIRLIAATAIAGRLATSDGRPIANAFVQPRYGRDLKAATNAAGEFEIQGLAPCEKDCILEIELDEEVRRGLARKQKDPEMLAGPPAWSAHSMAPWSAGQQISQVEIRLESVPLVAFSGAIAGPPLPDGTSIHLARADRPFHSELYRNAKARQTGAFAFELLHAGDYLLQVRKWTGSSYKQSEIPVRLDGSQDPLAQSIAMPEGAAVTGVVTLGGKPFYQPGFSIMLSRRDAAGQPRTAQAEVQKDGTFSATGLEPGKWSATGFSLSVQSGQRRNLSIGGARQPYEWIEGANPPIEVVLVETAWVQARIFDAAGKPAQGSITLVRDNVPGVYSMGSDPDGIVRTMVPHGTYRVSAWARGTPGLATPPACAASRTVVVDQNVSGLELTLCPVPAR